MLRLHGVAVKPWRQQLDELSKFEPRWDNQGETPTREAIAAASALLELLEALGQREFPGMFPTLDSGIALMWGNPEAPEIEISANGSMKIV